MVRRHDEAELPHGRELPLHGQLQNQTAATGSFRRRERKKRSKEHKHRVGWQAVRAYGAGGVPGADDGLGAVDVRDEVAADLRVLHLERHVQLRPAVPRLRGAALAALPAGAAQPRRRGACASRRAPGRLVPHRLRAEAAEPPPAEGRAHAQDVVPGAVLYQAAALALGALYHHLHADWRLAAGGGGAGAVPLRWS